MVKPTMVNCLQGWARDACSPRPCTAGVLLVAAKIEPTTKLCRALRNDEQSWSHPPRCLAIGIAIEQPILDHMYNHVKRLGQKGNQHFGVEINGALEWRCSNGALRQES